VQGGAPGSPGKLVFPTPLDRLRSDAAERGVQQPDEEEASLGCGVSGFAEKVRAFMAAFRHRACEKLDRFATNPRSGSSSKKAGVMGAGP
jgi:hypothetical protein